MNTQKGQLALKGLFVNRFKEPRTQIIMPFEAGLYYLRAFLLEEKLMVASVCYY